MSSPSETPDEFWQRVDEERAENFTKRLDQYLAEGYTYPEAFALCGLRLVNETQEEWRKRTSDIISRKALNGLAKALERQKRKD